MENILHFYEISEVQLFDDIYRVYKHYLVPHEQFSDGPSFLKSKHEYLVINKDHAISEIFLLNLYVYVQPRLWCPF